MLAAVAARLNRTAGRPAVPALYFFTDPARTPDPVTIAARLPRGAAVVYRAFGAANRLAVATALVKIARRRGLMLLIGADAGLARRVKADGVHLPERLGATASRLKSTYPDWIVTAAAHGGGGLQRQGADALILAPVLPSRSASAVRPLGALRAMRLAQTARAPVIALGGVNARTARRLTGRGFAGLAAVDGFGDS